MPVDWKLYPKDWIRIAREKKESASWKCEMCGKQCRKPGEPFDTHRRTLTVHHIDMDPGNCVPENLIALCACCHLKVHAERRKESGDGRGKEERVIEGGFGGPGGSEDGEMDLQELQEVCQMEAEEVLTLRG